MRLDAFMVAIIIGSIFLVGGSLLFNEVASNYNVDIENTEFQQFINKTNETYKTAEQMKEKLEPGEVTVASALDIIFSGAFSAIVLIWDSFGLAGAFIYSFGMAIGLPGPIISLLIAILMVLILFAIIYLVVRFQNR